MHRFRSLFPKNQCCVIGMVHVGPFPGTPLFKKSINEIVEAACKETEIYLKNGIDSILVENMHDVPYVQAKDFTPETVASMSRICTEIRRTTPPNYPLGVQVLASGNKEALAIAKACSLDFIRAEGFVFSHIADEGFTDANAGTILRYRRFIDADDVLIFADIKKKHSSHALTSDVSLLETAKAAEFFLADGVILTGTSTGSATNVEELEELKMNCHLPVLIGSGVTVENLESYLKADALIIGSHFKKDGKWSEDVDERRVERFMKTKLQKKKTIF